MKLRLLSLALALLAHSGPAWAETIVFQEEVSPNSSWTGTADTYVEIDNGYSGIHAKWNFGNSDTLKIGNRISPYERFILCKFDFVPYLEATYPNGFVITGAFVGLYQTDPGTGLPAGADDLNYISRILKPWTEGTTNNAFQAGSASYDSAKAGSSWNGVDNTGMDVNNFPLYWVNHRYSPGTADAGDDSATVNVGIWGTDTMYSAARITDGDKVAVSGAYGSAVYWSKNLGATQARGWYFWEVTRDAILMMQGDIENNGWYWTNSEGASVRVKSFASRNYSGDKRRRPKLVIMGYALSASGSGSGGTVLAGGVGSGIGGR